MPRPVLMLRLPGGGRSPPPGCAAQAGPAARPLLTRRIDGGRGCHLAGRDRRAGRGRGRGPGAGQRRRGRATQRKVRAVLPALPRSESAPRSCPRCSPRPARSPLLRAHPRLLPSRASSGFSLCGAVGVPGPRLPGPSRSTARLGPAGSGTPSSPRRCPGWRSLRTPFYAFAGSPGVGDTAPRGAVPRRRSEWASDPFECRGQLASETKASQYCHLACQGRATGLPGSPARAVEEGLREGAQKCARPPSL